MQKSHIRQHSLFIQDLLLLDYFADSGEHTFAL